MNRATLYGLFIALIALVVFLPSVTGEFLWDDEFLIVHNPQIKSLKNIPLAFGSEFFFKAFETPQITFYRPIITILNTYQYAAFGLRPFWWHLLNILMHGANTVLCYLFLIWLLKANKIAALFGALVFAVHPVHTESVSFISGRTDLLALLFIFGALLFFFEAQEGACTHRRFYTIVALILFLLGLLSKELVLMFPIAVIGVNYVRSDEQSPRLWARNRLAHLIYSLVPFFVVGALYLLLRFLFVKGIEVPAYPSGSSASTWLTMPKVFCRYVWLTLVPVGLRCDYTGFFAVETMLLAPRVISALCFLTLTVALSVWLFVKKSLYFAGVLWFLVFLFPVMNIFPLGLWMAERFLYIPSVGLAIMASALVQDFQPLPLLRPYRRLAGIAGVMVIILFAGLTLRRAAVWKDAETLWADAVKKSPENPQARIIYAQILFARGKYKDAAAMLDAAAILDAASVPDSSSLYLKKQQTYIKIYIATGRFSKAEVALKKANSALPASSYNAVLEGRLRLAQGKIDEAADAFKKALMRSPQQLGALVGLMEINVKRGDSAKELLKLAEKAISLNPDYAPSYIYRGIALRALGKENEAIRAFQEAMHRAPASPDAYLFLADLYEVRGAKDPESLERAAALYFELLRRHPDNVAALNNLAILYARTGRRAEARRLWKRVLDIKPDDAITLENLRRSKEHQKSNHTRILP